MALQQMPKAQDARFVGDVFVPMGLACKGQKGWCVVLGCLHGWEGAGQLSLNHCCIKWMRSRGCMAKGCWPRRPLSGGVGLYQRHQFRAKNYQLKGIQEFAQRNLGVAKEHYWGSCLWPAALTA